MMKPFFIINVVSLHEKDSDVLRMKISVFDTYYAIMRPLCDCVFDSPEFMLFAIKMDKVRCRKFVYQNGDYKGVIY